VKSSFLELKMHLFKTFLKTIKTIDLLRKYNSELCIFLNLTTKPSFLLGRKTRKLKLAFGRKEARRGADFQKDKK
jgi:hypothetical protein